MEPASSENLFGSLMDATERAAAKMQKAEELVVGRYQNSERALGLAEGDVVATTGSFLMKTEILKSNIGAGCCEVDPGR